MVFDKRVQAFCILKPTYIETKHVLLNKEAC